MSKLLLYSFRTNKMLKQFEQEKIPVFVFGSLKTDLEKFFALIEAQKPEQILGFAAITANSRAEITAVNKFNRTKQINKTGKGQYRLANLSHDIFPLAQKPTYSFCNWTMYKIAEKIETSKQSISLGFIHAKLTDTNKIIHLYHHATHHTQRLGRKR